MEQQSSGEPMDERQRIAAVAAALGIQLRRLAHMAGEYVRVSDEMLLIDPGDAFSDAPDPRAADEYMTRLQSAADVLGIECDRYEAIRDVARRLRDGA